MNQTVRLTEGRRVGYSACPHDCPSTCALEIDIVDGTHRPRARREGQRLHVRRRLRQGRALRRARQSSRPSAASAAPRRPERLRPLRAHLLGRRARHRRREIQRSRAAPRRRERVAVLLRRHDGAGDARRHQPPAPRQEVFRLSLDDLRQPGLCRLLGRLRQGRRRRSARDGEVRPDRDLGHQPGEHAGQRDDAREPRPKRARREDRGRRRLHERHDGAGRPAGAGEARHRRRARLRGDALPVPRRLRRPGLSRQVHRCAARAGSACEIARSGLGLGDHRHAGRDHRGIRAADRRDQAHVFQVGLRLLALAQRRGQHARGKLRSRR